MSSTQIKKSDRFNRFQKNNIELIELSDSDEYESTKNTKNSKSKKVMKIDQDLLDESANSSLLPDLMLLNKQKLLCKRDDNINIREKIINDRSAATIKGDDANSSNSNNDEYEITLIQKENIESKDLEINKFVNFSIETGIFDNTFYDYGNAFSVIATKLPIIFEKISSDGEHIKKNLFIKHFKKIGYNGNIHYIFNKMDEDLKGNIDWIQFVDFFLPFVKFVTI
jgi:hypothetical protein